MDLELATLRDIVKELERRRLPFLLVGIEATNASRDATVIVSAGTNQCAVGDLLRMARNLLEGGNDFE